MARISTSRVLAPPVVSSHVSGVIILSMAARWLGGWG
jgi:hypothetical protein